MTFTMLLNFPNTSSIMQERPSCSVNVSMIRLRGIMGIWLSGLRNRNILGQWSAFNKNAAKCLENIAVARGLMQFARVAGTKSRDTFPPNRDALKCSANQDPI